MLTPAPPKNTIRLLSSIVNGGAITSITQDAEGNDVIRFKGADNIEHSVTVATKDDVSSAPILGTKEENGVLYWTTTVDGNTDFLKDTDGSKIPVAGRTPEMAVDKEGYWTLNGRRLTDASGNPVKAEGKQTSLITGISRDDNGNAIFTLGDGSTVSAPIFDAFNIVFKIGDTVFDDEDTVECGAQDMWHCIKWVEEITGEKWDWEHYFTVIRRFNEQTKMEMEKWEMNSTPYPQLIGPCYELFRKWNYEMDGGLEPSVMKTFYKVRKLMYQSYEEKCNPYRHPMKYRAVAWSCPAHYYANFSNWLANAWGIGVLVEMESLNFTKQLETEDHEEAIRDLARLYERMVMRKHTNGGYVHVLDELWKVCEQFNANFIIMYQHVCCKTMAGLQGLFDEQARERGLHLIWVEHDLMDPRTVSRRDMRAKVNNYMRAIIQAEPTDESLLEFEDDITW